MNSPALILASASPRRKQLLDQLGVVYSICAQNIDESQKTGESPKDLVKRLALEKAEAGLKQESRNDVLVLGADTIVLCDQVVFSKPLDKADAMEMLLMLSGKAHRVLSAVALVNSSRGESAYSDTIVQFRDISQIEAEHYWATGEPEHKAGAYAIQGFGAAFVKSITGSYSGVMGLPLFETAVLLNEFGVCYWRHNQDSLNE